MQLSEVTKIRTRAHNLRQTMATSHLVAPKKLSPPPPPPPSKMTSAHRLMQLQSKLLLLLFALSLQAELARQQATSSSTNKIAEISSTTTSTSTSTTPASTTTTTSTTAAIGTDKIHKLAAGDISSLSSQQQPQQRPQSQAATRSKLPEQPNQMMTRQTQAQTTALGPASKLDVGGETNGGCDYDKSKWDECSAEGTQRRTLTLRSPGGATKCDQTKTIQRDCKAAGCKYARGQWASGCLDGKRVRVDRLVGRIGNATNCKPERKVTKDCRRACHYVKSAWSDCSNGFRTRNLTLDETSLLTVTAGRAWQAAADSGPRQDTKMAPGAAAAADAPTARGRRLVVSMAPIGQHCARQKLIRRECRPNLPARLAASPTGKTQILSAQQRRRLASKQQQQQQQLQLRTKLKASTDGISNRDSNNQAVVETRQTK